VEAENINLLLFKGLTHNYPGEFTNFAVCVHADVMKTHTIQKILWFGNS
jgi:hypothetical protein